MRDFQFKLKWKKIRQVKIDGMAVSHDTTGSFR